MTLSTSFFTSWKTLTPSERSMRSEDQQSSLEQMMTYQVHEKALTGFTSIELLVGVAAHVFDRTVRFQRLEQQRKTCRFNSL